MPKVHPQVVASSKQEVFTLWMKSLILSTNGCVAFDANGHIVYRVDNYSPKFINQVYIMDSSGKVVVTLVKKRFSLFGMWKGYQSTEAESKAEKPRFRVRKVQGIKMIMGFMRGYSYHKVAIEVEDNTACEYMMENQISKLSCRIVDNLGGLVAEVKRKGSKSGVVLGEDVLSMVVEPHIDHSLVMGLVVVLALNHQKL